MIPTESAPLIIGIGNSFRSDDGVGIWVARQIRARVSSGVSVLEVSGEGGALLEAWKGRSSVTLVDATFSGAAPGCIRRFDPTIENIRTSSFRCSSHAFGVEEAIELARVLDQLPPDLIVYGIEGHNFGFGLELSPAVAQSAAEVAERLLTGHSRQFLHEIVLHKIDR